MSGAASTSIEPRLGRYRLTEQIGQGGTASVYRGVLAGLAGFEKTVVVKRLHAHLVGDARYEQLFANEARRAASVQHPNLVQTFELDRDPETRALFMVMEHVDGVDARRLLAREARPLPVALALFVMIEVLAALQALAETSGRVVHADVTPENVFLSKQGDVKLGDLGMATAEDGHFEPFVGRARGKLPYMSPEQTEAKPLDARSDVFSAALVLWELLTARRLFEGRDASETAGAIRAGRRPPAASHNPEVPAAVDAILRDALAPDLADRPASPGAMRAALAEQLAAFAPGRSPSAMRAWLGQLVRDARAPRPPTLDADASSADIPPPPSGDASASLPSSASGPVFIPMPGGPADVETHEIVPAADGWAIRPHGAGRVWVRVGRTTWGPFARDGALTRLERLPASALTRVALSTDGQRWRALPAALEALGLSLLPDHGPRGGESASLGAVSLVRRLGELEAQRRSGRLVLVAAGRSAERRDVEIRRGQLVAVRTNRAGLEAALDAIGPSRAARSARARAEAALEAPLRWTEGRATFVEDEGIEGTGWRPLTWMLPRRLAESCSSDLLRARLGARLDAPARRTARFDERVRQVGLVGHEARRAASLADGRPLRAGLTDDEARSRFDLALAWTLLELDALSSAAGSDR